MPLLAANRHPVFVGRRRELSLLLASLEAAKQGQGSVVLVSGEPGAGKTRLLAELAQRARGDRWRVLNGRAYDTEGMPPYLPWTEALRSHTTAAPAEELRGQLGTGAADITLLVPELARQFSDLDHRAAPAAEHERYSLFESVVHFLLSISRTSSRPAGLLLVLDDLHWFDAPTVQLLLHLARRLGDAPLLVAAAYREAELTPLHPLAGALADLKRERLSQQLVLGALSADEVTEFVNAVAGPVASAVAEAIHHETEGNPFFVEEVLRHLQTESYDLTDPRTAKGGWGLPHGVRHVAGQRLSRLSPDTNRMLQVGAVLGDRWPVELLTSVSEMAFEQLAASLDEAVHAQILREEGDGYQFTHALIRRTVYDALSLPVRQRFHMRAASAIETAAGSNPAPFVAVLAAHYRRAGTAAAARAADYAQQAAKAARAVYAWEEEAQQWQTAVELAARQGTADQAQYCELLLALGDARVRAGERARGYEANRQAVALARRLGLADQLARALLAQVEELSPDGRQTERPPDSVDNPIALLEEALRAVGSFESALHARVLARLALELYMVGESERSEPLSDVALTMARRLDDPPTLAAVLRSAHKTRWGPHDLPTRLNLIAEMLRLAETTGDRGLALTAYNTRILDLLAAGEIAALDDAIETYAALVEELRRPPQHLHAVAVERAMRRLLAGDFADAERLVHEARIVGEQVQCPDTPGCFQGQILQLRRLQGQLQELDDERQRALEQAAHPWTFCAGRALHHSELGQMASARREFEHLAADDFAALPRTVTWARGLANHVQVADACANLGDAPRAAMLYERLAPYAGQAVVGGWAVVCMGAVDRCVGRLAAVLGDWEAATGHFETALAMNARMGARPWLAHTQRQYAQLLARRRSRGDRRRARQLLGAALALYSEMGMDSFAAETRSLLASPSVAGVPPSVPSFPDGLTAREVEVLTLIASGKSNREISEQLVLSVRTVGRHIANIYTKIGAHNKADATAYALRHDLASLLVPA